MKQHTYSKSEETLVRILAKDISGNMSVYAGLATIKGISWAVANALCKQLKIPKNKKIGELTKEEIATITAFMKHPAMPEYIKNRQRDFDSGEDRHLVGSDLELRKEFDIKRLKKIKSYRGIRHAAKLPLRGQRTKGNFRTHRKKGGGIKKKNKNEKKA